jgi:hypothetical protein
MDSQREAEDMNILKTNMIQCEALKLLNPECDCELELKLIWAFGHEWRVIINQFLENKGRIPTPEDLLWCSSLDEHLGKDIRVIVTELKKQA